MQPLKQCQKSQGFFTIHYLSYGDSGLGKTHLLMRLVIILRIMIEMIVILYQTADRFVNEFINAIRFDNNCISFEKKYKEVDVLLIDDIQFISNKEQTQEAFFHIFNAFMNAHKQIVFSGDVYPRIWKAFPSGYALVLAGDW